MHCVYVTHLALASLGDVAQLEVLIFFYIWSYSKIFWFIGIQIQLV
jgi:hypothetical protein